MCKNPRAQVQIQVRAWCDFDAIAFCTFCSDRHARRRDFAVSGATGRSGGQNAQWQLHGSTVRRGSILMAIQNPNFTVRGASHSNPRELASEHELRTHPRAPGQTIPFLERIKTKPNQIQGPLVTTHTS